MSSKAEMQWAISYKIWDESSRLVILLAELNLEHRRAVSNGDTSADYPRRVWALIGDQKDKIETLLKQMESLNATTVVG